MIPLSLSFSTQVRRFLRPLKQWRAQLRGEVFHCRSLAGESDYNLGVQCDLSVVCNCQDTDGSGHLGSLRQHSLREILNGPRAQSLRRSLAAGRLPLLTCARCMELRRVALRGGHGPTPAFPLTVPGLMLENTIACNLACPGCIRPLAIRTRLQSRLSMDDMEHALREIATLHPKRLYYFNRGEPFLSPTILMEMKAVRRILPGICVHMATNGLAIDTDDKRAAALMMDEIEISIDGVTNSMVRRYQKGGSFDIAYKNMLRLVRDRDQLNSHYPVIEWKYLLFNWNDQRRTLRKAIALARECGVDAIFFQPVNSPFYGYSLRTAFGALRGLGLERTWRGFECAISERRSQPVPSASEWRGF